MFVMKRLEAVAESVKLGESKSERLEILKNQLRMTVLPTQFQLPLNPHIKVIYLLYIYWLYVIVFLYM
jgi:hypothetical protein